MRNSMGLLRSAKKPETGTETKRWTFTHGIKSFQKPTSSTKYSILEVLMTDSCRDRCRVRLVDPMESRKSGHDAQRTRNGKSSGPFWPIQGFMGECRLSMADGPLLSILWTSSECKIGIQTDQQRKRGVLKPIASVPLAAACRMILC